MCPKIKQENLFLGKLTGQTTSNGDQSHPCTSVNSNSEKMKKTVVASAIYNEEKEESNKSIEESDRQITTTGKST